MNYKGAYSGSTNYAVGDVVVYTDGVAYEKFAASGSGVTPHDTHVWQRVPQPMQDVVLMFHSAIIDMNSNISSSKTTENNLSKMIAPEYSKKVYSENDLVTHNGKLYYAKADIDPADSSWTAAHWQETNLSEQIAGLQGE